VERHWVPIVRQSATREEHHSGRMWPTNCNKPKWAPLSSTAQCALSPWRMLLEMEKRIFGTDDFLEGV
jgi:hypothetical protein